MTNDIRGMISPNKPDLSGLETAFKTQCPLRMPRCRLQRRATGTTIGPETQRAETPAHRALPARRARPAAHKQDKAAAEPIPELPVRPDKPLNPAVPAKPAGGAAAGGAAAGGAAASGAAATSGTAATSTTTTTAGPVVKLVGSAAELRFDISRLPRVDQYKGMLTSKGEMSTADLPSDVKTICYFMRSETIGASYAGQPQAPGGEASTDSYGRGLMRAEMDRAVASYAETSGGTASVYDSAQLLANEVVGLGFEYFDGTEWLTEWDSDAMGGLPRAIRVWLSIKPTYGMSEEEMAQAAAGKATVDRPTSISSSACPPRRSWPHRRPRPLTPRSRQQHYFVHRNATQGTTP